MFVLRCSGAQVRFRISGRAILYDSLVLAFPQRGGGGVGSSGFRKTMGAGGLVVLDLGRL